MKKVWNFYFCNLPPFRFSNRRINERDVIICDVVVAINSRNILRKLLDWKSLMQNYLVMHVSLN
jgi:hypothetical protein